KARATVPVELQPVAGPIAPELRRDRVAGLCDVVRRARVGLGKGEPVPSLLLQPIDPEPPEKHVVRGLILRVSFQVQWFEGNRLELHPENQPPYDVLLGRLGGDRLPRPGRGWFSLPK